MATAGLPSGGNRNRAKIRAETAEPRTPADTPHRILTKRIIARNAMGTKTLAPRLWKTRLIRAALQAQIMIPTRDVT